MMFTLDVSTTDGPPEELVGPATTFRESRGVPGGQGVPASPGVVLVQIGYSNKCLLAWLQATLLSNSSRWPSATQSIWG